MFFYRIKQFIDALTACLTEGDKLFIEKYLTAEEQKLFYKLKVHEQAHSLRVAYEIEKEMANCDKSQKEEMLRLGLLHDIGKMKYPLNPIEKGIIVVLHKCTKGKINRLSGWKLVKCYYHHPEIGYELLKQVGGYDEAFLQLILGHHKEVEGTNDKLTLLKKCDDRS